MTNNGRKIVSTFMVVTVVVSSFQSRRFDRQCTVEQLSTVAEVELCRTGLLMDNAARWADIDTDFQLSDILGGAPFSVVRGEADSPWTVTAPHAVAHLDDQGTSWPADRGTGGLALLLSELGVARSLVTGGRWDADADSVPSPLCPFKTALLEEACPTLVVDLHEGRKGSELVLDVGVRPELVRRPLNMLIATAEDYAFPVLVKASCPTEGRQRVVDALLAQSVPALRVSIPSEYLDPWTAPRRAKRLVAMMSTFLSS